MLSIEEIERAILEHEARDTTYANCERLAWLYIVRDHILQSQHQPAQTAILGDSDFLRVAAGKDPAQVMLVMDELMTVLLATQPQLYQSVLRRLQ